MITSDISTSIIIDPWAFQKAKPQGEVRYGGGNRLVYTPTIEGDSVFDYITPEKTIRLNDLIRKIGAIFDLNLKVKFLEKKLDAKGIIKKNKKRKF